MQVEPRIARSTLFGNKFAYFEFTKPEGAQSSRHRFKITVHELHWDLDPAKVRARRALAGLLAPLPAQRSERGGGRPPAQGFSRRSVPESHGPAAT